MFYLNFVVITSDVPTLRTFLVNRNIIAQQADGSYVGVLPGME